MMNFADVGMSVETETYPGLGHGSNSQEVDDVKDFIEKVLMQQC